MRLRAVRFLNRMKNITMAKSIFICPTLYLLSAFPNSSWKVLIPPGTHGEDLYYYFPTSSLFGPIIERPAFNNAQFLDAFSGAFMAFVVSQDPND
ncbi:hypothetical protein BT96DRAFT_1103552 [Gymnopus androsaceus JB14]|uniref:Carboxylesterase type B domain-containing protein n=1 Tax=Gymnopus androsaceus JB14 TaxID=1447944 RepID=A0A6A4ID24_9AGAR|nr:hypothetical protein BT96DRAFT_1103552 [Gymnopus androsaceus JB14]